MRILVTYASGFGSTAEVADAIGEMLRDHDDVVVEEARDVISVEPYDAVLIGSPIRAGKWLRSATSFLAEHQSGLAEKPVAYFTLSLAARDEHGHQKVSDEVLGPLQNQYPKIKPVAVGIFGGRIDYQRLPWLIRGAVRRVNKKEGLPTTGCLDFRDWDAIRAWSDQVRSKLERSLGE